MKYFVRDVCTYVLITHVSINSKSLSNLLIRQIELVKRNHQQLVTFRISPRMEQFPRIRRKHRSPIVPIKLTYRYWKVQQNCEKNLQAKRRASWKHTIGDFARRFVKNDAPIRRDGCPVIRHAPGLSISETKSKSAEHRKSWFALAEICRFAMTRSWKTLSANRVHRAINEKQIMLIGEGIQRVTWTLFFTGSPDERFLLSSRQ